MYRLTVFLAIFLSAGIANAGSIRDWSCPDSIEGRWFPYSRGGDYSLGALEVGEDYLWFSQHGQIHYEKQVASNGKIYWRLLTPFALTGTSEKYKNKYLTFYLPHEREPIGPEEKCLMQIVLTETEEDILKAISKDKSAYTSRSSFLPLAHAVEFMGVKEHELGFKNMNKASE